MALTPLQKQYIIGFILGDSRVEKNGKNCRIRFDHSIKQLAYLQWKHKLLAPFSGKLVEYTRSDKRLKKLYGGCRFYTFSRPEFTFYRHLFYPSGKKQVPANIGDYLTAAALTSWFLDDGSRKTDCSTLILHTNSYLSAEVEFLRRALKDNFSISTRLGKSYSKNKQDGRQRGFILHMNPENSKKMALIVKPLIERELPLFLYKLWKPCND